MNNFNNYNNWKELLFSFLYFILDILKKELYNKIK